MGVASQSNSIQPPPIPDYGNPKENTEGLKEAPNAEPGVLYIDVFGIKDLGSQKMKDNHDILYPFCKIIPTDKNEPGSDKGSGYKTKKLRDTSNPVWNQRIRIPCPNGKIPAFLAVKVKTGRVFSKDETLGKAFISLEGLTEQKPITMHTQGLEGGEGYNENTKITVSVSYNSTDKPFAVPSKGYIGGTKSKTVKKFSQAASVGRKNVLRETTKFLLYGTRLGTDGFKKREWIGGCVCSAKLGPLVLTVYSDGARIDNEVKEEKEDGKILKAIKAGILKLYDAIEIACLEVQRQKQSGSVGTGYTLDLPLYVTDASMTILFDIVTEYVQTAGARYMKGAMARAHFDGAI